MTSVQTFSNKKVLAGIMSLLLVAFMAVPFFVGAQSDQFGLEFGKNTGLGTRDPRETVALVIRIIMGFLGTIAIVIILLGGFKWMTAGGNDEKVTEARKLITAGIIGLIIILSAYAITNFVITQLMTATNAGRAPGL